MFNVLVSASGTAWETDQLMRMDSARFKEFSEGTEAATIGLNEPDSLKLLEGISTLLMYEQHTDGPNTDVVRYGHLVDIRITGRELVFRFEERGRCSRSVVKEFSKRLGLHKFEHGRTHWAIKDGDLPSAMLDKIVASDTSKRKIAPFISYAREDAEMARRLHRDLSSAGVTPWLDSEKLLGGQDWEVAIRSAIRNSSHFLALISEHSVNKRGFVQKELAHALEILDEFPPDQIFVIPIRLDASSPTHERLRKLHWIDLFLDYDVSFQRIIDSLRLEPTGRFATATPRPAESSTDTTAEVRALIRARAQRDYPEDFSTQKYVIDNELDSWRKLQAFSAPGIPPEVVTTVVHTATKQYPDDFSTRLYVIENELKAWRDLEHLNDASMPRDILQRIRSKAEREYPDDFGTRLHVIQNEIAAWKDLQQ